MDYNLLDAITTLAVSEEGNKISDAVNKRLSGEDPEACGVNLSCPLVKDLIRCIVDTCAKYDTNVANLYVKALD